MVQHVTRSAVITGLAALAAFLATVPSLFLVESALAASRTISIFDCEGNSRLTQSIPETSNVTVAVDLNAGDLNAGDLAAGERTEPAAPKLTQREGEKTVQASRIQNNRAFFENVGDGSWSVCGPNGEKIAFSRVIIQSNDSENLTQSSGAGLLERNGGIIGASVATVGAVAMAVGSGSSSGSQGASAERGAAGISTNPALTPVDRRPQVGVTADDFNDEDFDFGAPAAPVSPFE